MCRSNVFMVVAALFSLLLSMQAADLYGAVTLPRSGQGSSYYPGDDGDIQAGLAWSSPRFSPGSGATADCMTDNLTGLMWVKNPDSTARSWQGALDNANGLTLCGYSDWRLPNRNELNSLISHGAADQSAWLNGQGFGNIQQGVYWSSTNFEASAWITTLSNGKTRALVKTSSGFIIPVRGTTTQILKTGQTACYDSSGATLTCAGTGQDGDIQAGVTAPTPRFTDNGDGTMTDNLTSLTWTKDCGSPGPAACSPGYIPRTWEGGLAYIACLNANSYLGHNDWRLPDIVELQSMAYSGAQTTAAWLTSQGFTITSFDTFITSTTDGENSAAFFLFNGEENMTVKKRSTGYAYSYLSWPVRGGVTATTPANLSVTPSYDFGVLTVGGTGSKSFTVTSVGGSSLQVSSATIAGADSSQFSVSSNGCTGTISPGSSCAIGVEFKPTTAGAKSASLAIVSNGSVSPRDVALAGTGKETSTHGWIDLSPYLPAQANISKIHFVGDKGWLAGGDKIVYYTPDGGMTFTTQSLPTPPSQTTNFSTSVHMRSPLEGYAVTNYGYVYRTVDGGANWTSLGKTNAGLMDIHFPPYPATMGRASGVNSMVWRITDAGIQTPFERPFTPQMTINSIDLPVNSSVGWLISGVSLRQFINPSWDFYPNYGGGQWYNAVRMADNLSGWVAGDDGEIIHTDDGVNWSSVGNNPVRGQQISLYGLSFLNDREGWAAGSSGTILHTTDAGANWSLEAQGVTNSALYSVFAVDGNTVYAAGDSTLLKYGPCIVPSIFTQPLSVAIDASQTATLTVTAPGTFPLNYQWYQGVSGVTTTPVGTNSNSYTTPALTSTTSYWVRVTNACGSVDSATATVTINACVPPSISAHPQGRVTSTGQTATLSVTASGTTPLSYQWYQGASGVTTSPVGTDSYSYTTPALSATTSFWARVTNACGHEDSNTAVVTVNGVTASAPVALPQSGQVTSYYAADDGDLRMGVAWPSPRFSDNGDGTMNDGLTGLIWTKNANAPGPSACTPGVYKRWQEAIDFITCLNNNAYLGFSDWRLPNVNELHSLMCNAGGSVVTWLTGQGFTNVQGTNYWTSTTDASATASAWAVGSTGKVGSVAKSYQLYLWPLRGVTASPSKVMRTGQTVSYSPGDDGAVQAGAIWPASRFTVSGSCVTDTLTGLMWPKSPDPTVRSWQDAEKYANALSLCGYTDWRLPNIVEMGSMVNYGVSDSAAWLNTQGFTNLRGDRYWSSTTFYNTTDFKWLTSLWGTWDRAGYLNWTKTYRNNIIPVRNAGTPLQRFVLTVEKTGAGSGTVTSGDGFISCGENCAKLYDNGAPSTLTATPDSNSLFSGWSCSNDCDCSDGKVTMNADKGCIARFDKKAVTSYQLAVTRAGAGFGVVKSADGAIYCGTECSSGFDSGEAVTLIAVPNAGSSFTGWSGDADCSDGNVTMDGAKGCTATFAQLTQQQVTNVQRTGQETSYATGDDAGILAGLAWPTPRFTARGECVTDDLTGLTWLKDPDFVWRNWQQALNYAGNFSACGYTDWRLPNVNELKSLLSSKVGVVLGDWLNSQGFAVSSPNYWSSTSGITSRGSAYMMGTGRDLSGDPVNGPVNSIVSASGKGGYSSAWPVRGTSTGPAVLPRTGQTGCYEASGAAISCTGTGQDGELQKGIPWPSPRFVANGDCITDTLTGLMWTKNANLPAGGGYPEDGARNWQGALDYANGLTLCGFDDWRLPNRNEMLSIVNYGTTDMPVWLAGLGFTNFQSLSYWTATTNPYATYYAVDEFLYSGNDRYLTDKTFANFDYVWPVRTTTAALPTRYSLSVTMEGDGWGTVTSNPQGLSCLAEWCAELFDAGTNLTLMATQDGSSLFSGWAGDCTGISGNNCTVTMNGDKNVTATFSILPPVRILGGSYYGTLQSAYGNCGPNCTIQAKGDELSGNLSAGSNSSVVLQGGYDGDYSTLCGYTLLKGILTILNGSLTLTNLIIE